METLAEVIAERDRLREVVRMADADRDYYARLAVLNAAVDAAWDPQQEPSAESRKRMIKALTERERLVSHEAARRLDSPMVRQATRVQIKFLKLLDNRINTADGLVMRLKAERDALRLSLRTLTAENRKLRRKCENASV